MSKALVILCGTCLLMGTVGCRSGDAVALSNNRLAAYGMFQGQQREVENFLIEAPEGGTISITGVARMRVATEAKPLRAMPENPTTAQTVVKEAANILKTGVQWVGGAYVLGEAFGAAKKEPIVVEQPEPIIEIIEIPAGAGNMGMVQ